MNNSKPLQVAVGVVKNAAGRILIARRKDSAHQGGLWEFPGGKIEPGETVVAALFRELGEELAITVQRATPLISIKHRYPDLAVQLHVWVVEQFSGVATGQEGQAIAWVAPAELPRYPFPEANRPIIAAARLPPCYAILDDGDDAPLLAKLQRLLAQDIKLIQARLKNTAPDAVQRFIERAYPLCRQHQTLLLLNSAVAGADAGAADGLHLTSRHLLAARQRPAAAHWVGASCHNLEELRHAAAIGVDFAVLAPVLPTSTHPDASALGWRQFAAWVAEIQLPVYALGGMSLPLLSTARLAGAQGIASISAFSD